MRVFEDDRPNDPWADAPAWATHIGHALVHLLRKTEQIMIDVSALKAAVARLQSSDTAALAMLQTLKDQNTALAAKLAAISTDDPATQSAINEVVTQLTTTADMVDQAVTSNPATPNLAPSPVG